MAQLNLQSPLDGELDVVAMLADRVIEASIEDLRRRDELMIAVRTLLKLGVSIDDLSNATGLQPAEIRRLSEGELTLSSDVNMLAGIM